MRSGFESMTRIFRGRRLVCTATIGNVKRWCKAINGIYLEYLPCPAFQCRPIQRAMRTYSSAQLTHRTYQGQVFVKVLARSLRAIAATSVLLTAAIMTALLAPLGRIKLVRVVVLHASNGVKRANTSARSMSSSIDTHTHRLSVVFIARHLSTIEQTIQGRNSRVPGAAAAGFGDGPALVY